MKCYDLSGQWDVRIDDGHIYKANLPGTLDENGIGYKDNNINEWKSDEVSDEDKTSNYVLYQKDVITTRYTRAYTYEGVAVFSKVIELDKEDSRNRIFLEVERSRKLSLRVNENPIDPYCEGTVSTPYIYEVTDSITGKSLVEFLCDNSYKGWPHDAIVYSSAATDETQTNWNGLLGYIRLRREKEIFISYIRVYAENSHLTVHVEIDAGQTYLGNLLVACPLLGIEVTKMITVEAGIHTVTFTDIEINDEYKQWDEYEGNLYELKVSGDDIDSKSVTFGIRDFKTDESGHLALNHRRIFLRSESNCCVFPETGHMPMSIEEWMKVIEVYKSYGINCLRFHSHCPSEAAFTAADRLGILMQPEFSHWNPKTAFEEDESYAYYQLELKQILRTYANHPSFVMLSFGNELSATDLGHKRMDTLIDTAKHLDPTRMYANGSNNHYGAIGADGKSDFYTASSFYETTMRGTSSPMTGHINECYPNSKTNYNNVIEEIRREYLGPVFSFEVGQYEVLPNFDEIEAFQGVTLPNNLMNIKEEVIKKGIYSDWKRRVEATGELALLSYREEIEAVLRTKDMSGISLLGLQDFPGQGTALIGMLNSHLKSKPFPFARPERFRAFFRSVLPLVLLEKYTYTNKEILTATVQIANYGKCTLNAPVQYELTDGDQILETGVLSPVTIPFGGLTEIGTLKIPLGNITKSKKLMLTIRIDHLENEYPVWVYADKPLKYHDEVVITRTYADTKRALAEGKKVFYSPEADEVHFPQSIKSHFTTDFWSVGTFTQQSGCMGCLIENNHTIFREFPTEAHSNWQWWPMTNGRAVILPPELKSIVTVMDSYARLRNLSILFECRVGSGRLMVSSMGLLEKQEYPEVRALTNSILNYMSSKDFEPTQEITLESFHKIFLKQNWKPGFLLNEHKRDTNPCFESHDPSMMWDPVSKMYYSYCTDTGIVSEYHQGIPIRKSKNLIDFEFVGWALSEEAIAKGRDNGEGFPPTYGFWAPYTEYVDGEYRMYYSATKAFGSSESRIWLAVAESPEGPFHNRGIVMDTWNTPDTEPNAIDAHVCDTKQGEKYFIYGSFFGGIFIKELDKKTGMPKNPDPFYQGICIAKKPIDSYIDGPEGAAIIYNPKTGYYYQFLSYGWLGDDYDIRVGRSKDIIGPYLDYKGNSLTGHSLGMKMAGSYCFDGHKPYAGKDSKDWEFDGFRGPGHGVPFYAPEKDEYFFVHHVRDGAQIFCRKEKNRQSFKMHYMVVRRMYFVDGWPIFSPEPYAGEPSTVTKLSEHKELLQKEVEWIILKEDNNTMVRSVVSKLPKTIQPEHTYIFDVYDYENSKVSKGLSGIIKSGEVIWGKFLI
ncbi:MAG: family 43 glycosylhydrolase [Anaerocolumna sp.]